MIFFFPQATSSPNIFLPHAGRLFYFAKCGVYHVNIKSKNSSFECTINVVDEGKKEKIFDWLRNLIAYFDWLRNLIANFDWLINPIAYFDWSRNLITYSDWLRKPIAYFDWSRNLFAYFDWIKNVIAYFDWSRNLNAYELKVFVVSLSNNLLYLFFTKIHKLRYQE